jgi:putative intracellular protease/amidase
MCWEHPDRPTYTLANAPAPKVIVIPAQGPASEATTAWIHNATRRTDVTMSVCTGAFVLASAGLLAGKAATHHGAYIDLAKEEHLNSPRHKQKDQVKQRGPPSVSMFRDSIRVSTSKHADLPTAQAVWTRQQLVRCSIWDRVLSACAFFSHPTRDLTV